MPKYRITAILKDLVVETTIEASDFHDAIDQSVTLRAPDFVKFGKHGWLDGGAVVVDGIFKEEWK